MDIFGRFKTAEIKDVETFINKNGLASGGINMNGNLIINLADPIDETDASNKKYLDDSIKGAKEYTDTELLTIKEEISKQSTLYNAISSLVRSLHSRVAIMKNVITIFAESKGALFENKMFSFGNGGRDSDVGYLMCYHGKIINMGVSTKKTSDIVEVVIYLNGKEQEDYKVIISAADKYNQIRFNPPLDININDEIGFVSKIANSTTETTVASAIIEIRQL